MKFKSAKGYVCDSYVGFEFTAHDPNDVIYGDQIWSDGNVVEIADFADREALDELIDKVDNKRAFCSALIGMDLI